MVILQVPGILVNNQKKEWVHFFREIYPLKNLASYVLNECGHTLSLA